MHNVFSSRAKDRLKAGELYGRVVAAARQPAFYAAMGVPDTPEGRFEMVSLMLFLGLDRLQTAGEGSEKLQQLTIEHFVTDMDDCLREMGVGDLTVPKKVRRAAGAFYERSGAYRDGLNDPAPAALREALSRYAYAGRGNEADINQLTGYVRLVRGALTAISDVAAGNGELIFPVAALENGGSHGRA